jgi:hypothetical protein
MNRIIIAALAALIALPLTATAATPITFDALIGHYEPIRRALLNDTTDGVAGHASAIAKIASEAGKKFSPHAAGVNDADGDECIDLLGAVAKHAAALAKAKDLGAARAAFWALSGPMIRYREMAGDEGPAVVYCSMEKKKWLQPEGEIGNPYTGQKMARCGQIVSK